MVDVETLELQIAKDYATKADLDRVEVALAGVDRRVASQEGTMVLVEYKLNGILGALNRIIWLIAGPLAAGTLAAIVWAVVQMMQ